MDAPITLAIVAITVLVSLWALNDSAIMGKFIFDPVRITNQQQYYRFITSGFIHADYIHLAFNMVALYSFGQFVENAFKSLFADKGNLLYIILYLLALIVSLLPTYSKNKHNQYYLGLGASGAVSAVVFAGLLLAPTVKVGLYFIPPIIPGYVFGPLYLVISYFLEKQQKGNINHSAHIFGALFGLGFTIVAGFALSNINLVERCIEMIKMG